MAESVRYQRIVLHFESPWNLGKTTTHEWGVKFSLSGATNIAASDCEATARDLAAPLLYIASTRTVLIGWTHYPIASATHDATGNFGAVPITGNGGAWDPGGAPQQLEVCVLAECQCGVSSKGRPVYLRKWCHDVMADPSNPNAPANPLDGPTIFDKWDHGCGPHNSVPVSPTTGQQGSGWTANTHLYTHQLRRGPKRKPASASALKELEDTALELAKAIAIGKLAGGVPAP